ncbi:tellurite resistance TerB family protein [Brevundimonas bacteroides]|uniref:tellurite resistance TerB family protein n=1 Tax=Brevundimonas bacteroides TaxID=74311 RepID=UPI00068B2692|nr:tellurite resistance TerB family protein [Brevundimonas bacteroides]
MTTLTLSRRTALGIDPHKVFSAGDVEQMDAIVAACALVAQADGWVTPDERRRMIDRMRASPVIAFFGADEIAVLFEALNFRFDRDPDDGEATAEAAVCRLRGNVRAAQALVETACAVAEADGGFDAEERAVILRLCQLLDLNPAGFDLEAAQPGRPTGP